MLQNIYLIVGIVVGVFAIIGILLKGHDSLLRPLL